MAVIETINLVKNYKRIRALQGVSIAVEQGEIYGLLGQNGAGKTTLIKVLLGIISGWEGEAKLLGEVAGTARVRSQVGYLPEDHRFPEYHTGFSLLDFYMQLLGVPRRERQTKTPAILEMVGLKGRMHSKIRTYSKGMKQRVGIAQAMVHNPKVIFLDEPTDGVDPIGRREIRAIMLDLKQRGTTIFLNSHLLGEVELVCDRVAILQKGLMVREGSVADLTRQRGHFMVGVGENQEMPVAHMAQLGFEAKRGTEFWDVEIPEGKSIDGVVDLLRAHGLSVCHLVEKRQSLEELFMATVDAAEPGIDRPAQAANAEAVFRR